MWACGILPSAHNLQLSPFYMKPFDSESSVIELTVMPYYCSLQCRSSESMTLLEGMLNFSAGTTILGGRVQPVTNEKMRKRVNCLYIEEEALWAIYSTRETPNPRLGAMTLIPLTDISSLSQRVLISGPAGICV